MNGGELRSSEIKVRKRRDSKKIQGQRQGTTKTELGLGQRSAAGNGRKETPRGTERGGDGKPGTAGECMQDQSSGKGQSRLAEGSGKTDRICMPNGVSTQYVNPKTVGVEA